MSLRDRLRSLFNRDIEYIDEYLEDDVEETSEISADDIDDETRVVIAVTVAALASADKDANYRIKSMKRIR